MFCVTKCFRGCRENVLRPQHARHWFRLWPVWVTIRGISDCEGNGVFETSITEKLRGVTLQKTAVRGQFALLSVMQVLETIRVLRPQCVSKVTVPTGLF